jgi:serine phosphatase RsbU (regulator of sigma subunit)
VVVPLAPDELLIIYTDGVTDTPGPRDRYGPERLRRLLSGLGGASPQAALDRLEAELIAFASGPGGDDTTALALRPRLG